MPTQRTRLRKYALVLVLPACTIFLCGCHHKQQQTYVPPPPTQTRPSGQTQVRNGGNAATHAQSMPDANARVLSSEVGLASWYGPSPRHTASGEAYTAMEMTAAHRTLPLNTIIRVTNLANGQSAVVRVNDRGPFVKGRLLDLSIAAARETGVYRAGTARVRIDVLSYPPSASTPGHWCVQIGAFQSQSNAVALKQQLLRRYNNSQVIEFPGDTGYWVRIKPSGLDRQHAIEVASNVRTPEQSVEAFLVRLD